MTVRGSLARFVFLASAALAALCSAFFTFYTVRLYYSQDGVNFKYKTAGYPALCCGTQPDSEWWQVKLTYGTDFVRGTLYLYAYGRDGNGPTLYDKNGGAYYKLVVQ